MDDATAPHGQVFMHFVEREKRSIRQRDRYNWIANAQLFRFSSYFLISNGWFVCLHSSVAAFSIHEMRGRGIKVIFYGQIMCWVVQVLQLIFAPSSFVLAFSFNRFPIQTKNFGWVKMNCSKKSIDCCNHSMHWPNTVVRKRWKNSDHILNATFDVNKRFFFIQ